VIGFAAETTLIDNAKAKLARKGCDWIVPNDVSPATARDGRDRNTCICSARRDDISVDSCRDEQGRGRHRPGGADRRAVDK